MKSKFALAGRLGALGLVCLLLAACPLYYELWERVGVEKRDLLIERVEEARDAQRKTRKQFESALDRFRAVVNVEGGALETKYDKLRGDLERCETRARDLHKRIKAVEEVAEDLLAEWKKELRKYNDPRLRRNSERALYKARERYAELIEAMKRAESRIAPALRPLQDQVLYLKHNLNAQAIGALQDERAQIEADVSDLLREMDAAIKEANDFIKDMERAGGGSEGRELKTIDKREGSERGGAVRHLGEHPEAAEAPSLLDAPEVEEQPKSVRGVRVE